MVRRSHVAPGSIACCPWWTLGGGALVAAAAMTFSNGPHRTVAGAAPADAAAFLGREPAATLAHAPLDGECPSPGDGPMQRDDPANGDRPQDGERAEDRAAKCGVASTGDVP